MNKEINIESGRVINNIGTEHQYKVRGMSCASCALKIEKTLNKVEGIEKAAVSFADKKARVSFDENKIKFKDLQDKVKEAGYKLLEEESNDDELLFIKKERNRLIWSWV